MANILKQNIDELEIDGKYVPEALKAILHTIVFQRALDIQRPFVIRSRLLSPLGFASVCDIDAAFVSSWQDLQAAKRGIDSPITQLSLHQQHPISKLIIESVTKFVSGVLKKLGVPQQQLAQMLAGQQPMQLSLPKQANSAAGAPVVPSQKHRLEVVFSEKRSSKGVFTEKVESVEFESWTINLLVKNPHEIANLYDLKSGLTVLKAAPSSSASAQQQQHARPSAEDALDLQTVDSSGTVIAVDKAPKELVQEIDKRLKMILKQAHEKTDHLPPMVADKLSFGPGCYPFDVKLPTLEESGAWFWPFK